MSLFSEARILGEGRPENLGKMGNWKGIYCHAKRGWSFSKENTGFYSWYQYFCGAFIFLHGRPNFMKK